MTPLGRALVACLVLAHTCHAFMPAVVTRGGNHLRLHRHISPSSPPLTRSRTSLAAVAPEVGEVLSRFGVDAAKHEELIAELAPLLRKAPVKKKISKVDAEVNRDGTTGSLGIDVDQDNIIRKNTGQPNLRVGDRITAVDGVALTGPAAAAITPGKASYTFTVERGVEEASGLENQIVLLASDEDMYTRGAGLAMLDPLKGPTAGGFLKAAESLEELGLDVGVEKVKGFWRLVWTNDLEFVPKGGLSELGSMPYCVLAAHLQCYQDKDPSLQTVEVIANMNTGTHSLASVKGSVVIGEQDASDTVGGGRPVTEQYTRLEFASAPQSYQRTEKACVVTYAGNKVRLARRASNAVPGKDGKVGPGQGLFIYIKRSPQEVGSEMQAWLDKPVAGGGGQTAARWEAPPGGRGPSGGESMLRD